ncbi:ABC transporter permease [Pantoea ananatis]|uniref:ABC transporter permease n=1 Tax=Pantoea ananas TaxID=553 RepID=UPI003FA450AA
MGYIIELKKITHGFIKGGKESIVLNDINLKIAAGELVAIIGPSGSGKSTLLNIIGCLTRQRSGDCYIYNENTKDLSSDKLANLRAKCIGFIFQRYHLMSGLTVQQNIEIPAIYTNEMFKSRHARSISLLNQLELAGRGNHKPSELSGGQQQRVSIARSLMNGGEIILADEPTGALDAHSRTEVMEIFKNLNERGHTIIIATHDMNVVKYAHRIINIHDGKISEANVGQVNIKENLNVPFCSQEFTRGFLNSIYAAFQMAFVAMNSNILRTILTMLGIIFGIAAVVVVVALGEGAKQRTLENIKSLGTNVISIYPGKDFTDTGMNSLLPKDATLLAKNKFVSSVSPIINSSANIVYRAISLKASVYGVGSNYFDINGIKFIQGMSFINDYSGLQEVVIDKSGAASLFGIYASSAIGKVIIVGSVPVRVVGVILNNNHPESLGQISLWMPFSTVIYRLSGKSNLENIMVRLKENTSSDLAIGSINETLKLYHGKKDFRIYNFDKIRKSVERTSTTFSILILMIALVSLVIGSIGVMNIMLVSITERKHEIGIRIAMGARRIDIMLQFIIEATLISLLGGFLGVILSYAIKPIFSLLAGDMVTFIYSWEVTITAFLCSCLVGIIFGYFPARKAALMDPALLLADE